MFGYVNVRRLSSPKCASHVQPSNYCLPRFWGLREPDLSWQPGQPGMPLLRQKHATSRWCFQYHHASAVTTCNNHKNECPESTGMILECPWGIQYPGKTVHNSSAESLWRSSSRSCLSVHLLELAIRAPAGFRQGKGHPTCQTCVQEPMGAVRAIQAKLMSASPNIYPTIYIIYIVTSVNKKLTSHDHRHNLQQPDIGLSGLTAGKTSLRGKYIIIL